MRSVRAELLPSTGWFGSVHASEFQAELTRRASIRLSSGGESRGEAKKTASLRAAMPSSVGMRRTTRVFGVVKGADGARVLRSGRRLWPDSGEEWLKTGGGEKGRLFEPKTWDHKPAPVRKNLVEAPVKKKKKDRFCDERLFGIVYRRKRKAVVAEPVSGRRQKRKLNSGEGVVTVVAGSELARNYCLAQFLCLVFVYMTRARLRLSDLFGFLASEPICNVISSSGISVFKVSLVSFCCLLLFHACFSVDEE